MEARSCPHIYKFKQADGRFEWVSNSDQISGVLKNK